VTDSQAPDATASTRRISYEPGLDGLRAISVLATFLVHANIGVPGGFLGVSTFFTLSGFLITAVIVSEYRSRGRIALGMFWQRRARRLMPAALLTITLVAAAALWFGSATQVQNLFGDTLGTLAYVANWRFMLADTTYGGEFSGQSPLLHFWSLAIEEQFYIVFPLVMVGALAASARWRLAVPAVLLLGIVLSLVAGIATSSTNVSIDKLYFRTDIRAGELLVGALFGYWWAGAGRHIGERAHQAIRWSGGGLFLLMLGLIATSDYHDMLWYRGGLIAYSLATVGVILAAVEPHGPVKRALSWKPLVWIGVISYGAYLAHWPLFMWLHTHTDLPGWARLMVGTAITLVLAQASYRAVELPVRERRIFSLRWLVGLGIALVALALTISLIAPKVARNQELTLDKTAAAISHHLTHTAAARGEAPTVGVFGDSTALVVALGLATFDDTDKRIRMGSGWADLGCTLSATATFRSDGKESNVPKKCTQWLRDWSQAAKDGRLDAALVQFGPFEVKTMKSEGVDTFQTIGEPAQDARLAQLLTAGIEALLKETPIVILTTSPYIEPGRLNGRSPVKAAPHGDPKRMDRLNDIIRDVAARYPNVAVLDLAAWIEAQGDDDRRLRPDGVHFTDKTALELGPRYAATINSIIDVANGAEPSAIDSDGFPVSQYARK
jgi:peptidoglycan/LPS O-acetylase OafA/YrhL